MCGSCIILLDVVAVWLEKGKNDVRMFHMFDFEKVFARFWECGPLFKVSSRRCSAKMCRTNLPKSRQTKVVVCLMRKKTYINLYTRVHIHTWKRAEWIFSDPRTNKSYLSSQSRMDFLFLQMFLYFYAICLTTSYDSCQCHCNLVDQHTTSSIYTLLRNALLLLGSWISLYFFVCVPFFPVFFFFLSLVWIIHLVWLIEISMPLVNGCFAWVFCLFTSHPTTFPIDTWHH